MANMADITNSCSSPFTPSGPTPSIKETAIPTQLCTRARFQGSWGTRKGREGRKRTAMEGAGCCRRDANFPGSGCSHSARHQGGAAVLQVFDVKIEPGKKKSNNNWRHFRAKDHRNHIITTLAKFGLRIFFTQVAYK